MSGSDLTRLDSLIARGVVYGGTRAAFFGYFYNRFNTDPRRDLNFGLYGTVGVLTGLCVGALVNPIDLVYSRQAADALLPQQKRWGYTSLVDGLLKASSEQVLLRGALATGLSYGLLIGSMSTVYDYMKEFLYYFFG